MWSGRFSKDCTAVALRELRLLPQVMFFLESLAVPAEWHDVILRKAQARLGYQPPPITQPSEATQQALVRLKRLYVQGDYSDTEYEREKAGLLAVDQVATQEFPREIDLRTVLQWLNHVPCLFRAGSRRIATTTGTSSLCYDVGWI